jgi:hypothetical protein
MPTSMFSSLLPQRRLAHVRLLAVCAPLVGCTATDLVFLAPSAGGDDGGPAWTVPDATTGDADGGRPNLDAGAGPVLCTVDGSAPTLSLGDGGCVGDLAARAFRFALCVCDDAVFNAGVTAIRSASVDGGASASLGINGNFITTTAASVGGSLWTRQAVTTDTSLVVDGELHCGTNLSRAGTTLVRSDAWVGGSIDVGSLDVAGTLTQPASSVNRATIRAGQRVAASVPAVAPCDCEPSRLLPISALVQSAASTNDDVAVGFDPQTFASVSTATTVTLPCGKLYASGVRTTAPLTLRVGAQTVLAVDGDLDLGGDFTVELTTPTASLDLLVAGTLRSNSTVRIGDAARPWAVRVYLGGATTVDTSASWVVHGNLYAPKAILNTSGGATMDGAIFVKSLAAAAPVTLGYDKRVLQVPDNCAPPSGCNDCRDCKGQACVGGRCGACTNSSQCCAPLVCAGGRCVPEAPLR